MQTNALYETAGGTRLLDPEFILAQLEVQPDQRVADLGSGGGGHFTFPLARRVGEAGMVYAVDVVQDTLKVIRNRARVENIKQIEPIHSNLEIIGATPIPPESLDRAICINVLFQNIHHDHILKEAHRLLKAGGKLLVVDWKQDTGKVGPPASRRVDITVLKEMAHSIGFESSLEFNASQWHFGLLLTKQS